MEKKYTRVNSYIKVRSICDMQSVAEYYLEGVVF
jgi:hypothetical protein